MLVAGFFCVVRAWFYFADNGGLTCCWGIGVVFPVYLELPATIILLLLCVLLCIVGAGPNLACGGLLHC